MARNFSPLQQRLARSSASVEHPGVEVQPGQLAVEEPVVGEAGPRLGLGSGRRLGRHDPHRAPPRWTAGEPRWWTCPQAQAVPEARVPSSRAVRGPRPSPAAARRSSAVSTSRRSPGHGPVSSRAPPARWAAAEPRPNRGSSATPHRGEQRGAGAAGVGDEAARAAGRRGGRAAVSSSGRSAGRSEDSAATAAGAGGERTVDQRRVQPAVGQVGHGVGAELPDDGGRGGVVGDDDDPGHLRARRARRRRCRPAGRAPRRRALGRAGGQRAQPRLGDLQPLGGHHHGPLGHGSMAPHDARVDPRAELRAPRVDHGQQQTGAAGPRRALAWDEGGGRP